MSAITGNTVRTGSLIDPFDLDAMKRSKPGPSPLLVAALAQKHITLRVIFDRLIPNNNSQPYREIVQDFLESRGIKMDVSDDMLFPLPRNVPHVPFVLRNDTFEPLCHTPWSAATKPIALFVIAYDWSNPKYPAIGKLLHSSFRPYYAAIAKHFTVVRVLEDDPDQLVPITRLVKALLPGVPLLHVNLGGHGHRESIRFGTRHLMTFSDVRKAFEERVQEMVDSELSQSDSEEDTDRIDIETQVRTNLLSLLALGEEELQRKAMRLSTGRQDVLCGIGREVAPQGTLALQACSCGDEDRNLALLFSPCAPDLTVYGCQNPCFNIVPKIFYTEDARTPQFLPFFLTSFASSGLYFVQVSAYRNGNLIAYVTDGFPKPTAIPGAIEGAIPGSRDINRSLFMGIEMTPQESNDPNWQQLTQAIGNPNGPAFAGSVCILAHDEGGCSHRSKKAKTDETP